MVSNEGSAEEKVLRTVESMREEILSFLGDLISKRSIPGKELEIQQFISAKLGEIGLEVDKWEPSWEELKKHPGYVSVEMGYEGRPNVVGICRGVGGGRSLLFNGHVDIIPADPANWSTDPWASQIREGQLFGRGASDMKSGLAAMTMAVKAILNCGLRPKGDIFLEYVMDEEYSGNGTLGCIQRGYRADAGISCEAGDLEIQPATTGSMWFEIEVEGKSASMSRRWEAVSAIEKGYLLYQAVSDFEQHRIGTITHPLYPDPRGSLACFVGQLISGTYPSAPPAKCILRGRMGALPSEDAQEAQRQFIEYLKAVAQKDPWLKDHPPRIQFTGYYAEPAEISPQHPVCLTLADVFKRVTGKEPVIKGHDGAADTRFLIKYGNIPTVIFGPGTIAQMHADNEWVRTEDVMTVTKVLAVTILNWCGYTEE